MHTQNTVPTPVFRGTHVPPVSGPREGTGATGPLSWQRGPVATAAPDPAHGGTKPLTTEFAAPEPPAGAVCWVAAHGGAGATSLAAALGGTDVGTRWPDRARGEAGRMLIVARTHAAGIQAASTVLDALRTGNHPAGLDLLGVVLVADAPGRLPMALARRVRVLRSAVTVHHVPWIPSWRVGARTAHLPRQVVAVGRAVGLPGHDRRGA
ncbi:DUF6668 family protein [Streptomyces globisporus]|uniref:DUF6668 family protein n=1 Tax=Streptomyces globisporus TaxID=1908 RepID=UPI00381E5CDD